tara:strand:- start:1254 stop:1904 length:651 start_codon:yes stop_codon:yes gene_type:complete
MALPASGTISLDQIHVEAGGTSGTTCTMEDADIRDIGDFPANTASSRYTRHFSDWHGKKAKWIISMTTGQTTVNTAGSDYVAANTERYRGYNGSSGTRPATNNTYGSLNDDQDADYLSNKTIYAFQINGSSSQTQPAVTAMSLQCADGCSNTDAAFKKVKVGTTSFNRSDATFSDTANFEQWTWQTGNKNVPNNTTGAISPFSAPGSTTTITFIGQ